MKKAVEDAIVWGIAKRAILGDDRAKRQIEAVTGIVRRYWLDLVEIIKAPKQEARAVTAAKVQGILRQMTAATEAAIEPELLAGAEWGFDSAFNIWEEHLPAEWWKIAFPDDPETVLLEGVEFNFPEPGGPGPSGKGSGKKKSAIEKLTGGPKPSKKKGKFPTAGKPKPPKKVSKKTASRIKASIKPSRVDFLKIVRSRGWKSRMRKWSAKLENLDRVAELIADGREKGKKFETIVNSVKPFVQGYAASARRVVRTELARIENVLLEKTFEKFSNIIEGYQIINPLDERTRPSHGQRAGTIYWKDKRKKPSADDRPSLPDEPNCRCTYAPVLIEPLPEEFKEVPRLDTRTYAGWFNAQTDEVKAKTVGRERWALMKKKSARPSWFDALDEKGKFIPLDRLKKEKPASTLSRRKKLRDRKQKDISVARKALRYFPPQVGNNR